MTTQNPARKLSPVAIPVNEYSGIDADCACGTTIFKMINGDWKHARMNGYHSECLRPHKTGFAGKRGSGTFHYSNSAGEVVRKFDTLDEGINALRSDWSRTTDFVYQLTDDGARRVWFMQNGEVHTEQD